MIELTVNRENIINELVAMPIELKKVQAQVLCKAEKFEKAKAMLKDRECKLLLDGAIDGKNAEQRFAQLREQTQEERVLVEEAEAELNRAKLELDYAYNRFKALRAVARILGGEVD